MKFTIIKREHLNEMKMLYALQEDNAYIIIDEYNGYSTIAQYSSKYDQVKLIDVKSENLDSSKRLQEG